MIVSVKNVTKKFDSVILQNFNLDVAQNEIVCILGPSGCGKTTLLNLIAGLSQLDSGTIDRQTDSIGYVFQEDRLLPWKTVYDNIAFVNQTSSPQKIMALIEKMGLAGYQDHFPRELSGGMQQRCSIARAFNYSADLLLMDEPFKSLDYSLRFKMVSALIDTWRAYRHAIVYVTHDIDEALLLADRIIILAGRPATIIDALKIDIARANRRISDQNLMQLRRKIIDYMV